MITRWVMKNWAVLLMLAAVGVLLLMLAGCSSSGPGSYDDKHGKGDAPVAGQKGDDSPASVTNMPDGFGNVATKCVAGAPGWRVFVTTNTGYAPSMMHIEADHSCDQR